MTTTMTASTVGRARRKPKTYGLDRVCADPTTARCGCPATTGPTHCFNHAPARFPRLRGEFTEEFLAK